MTTIRVSATHARNNFFELLNQIALGDTEVVIEKDSKEVAVLSPKRRVGVDKKALLEASEKVRGIFKDDPSFKLKNLPTRRPGAWPNVGKWDKNFKWPKKA